MAIATLGKGLLARGLITYWKRNDPPVMPVREFSMNPTDNLQIAMNLVMPLADPRGSGRAHVSGSSVVEAGC